MKKSDNSLTLKTTKYLKLGLIIFGVTILALAPALVLVGSGWPGAFTVGLFAMGGAAAAVVAGGFRLGVIVSITIALAAAIAMPLSSYPWAIAILMGVLGAIYGFWASKGYASGAMLIPALVPYLVHDPPGIFTTAAPTINVQYILVFISIWIISGIWTSFVMQKLVLKGKSFPSPSQSTRITVIFGLFMGSVAGIVAATALSLDPRVEWPWIILTMFILASPSGKLKFKQVRDRIIGTVIGLGLALLVTTLPLRPAQLGLLAILLMTASLVVRILKKPYWAFVMVMTPAIIIMDSTGSNTEVVAEQRLLFTLLGVLIIVFVTTLANLAWSLYMRRQSNIVNSQ